MISLIPLKDNFTIYQLQQGQAIPHQIMTSGFCSVTKTSDEISIVTNCSMVFDEFKIDKEWRGFMIEGILDFSLVGILHDIIKPLKENRISVFVISTFNTDYIFVNKNNFQLAKKILNSCENIEVKSE